MEKTKKELEQALAEVSTELLKLEGNVKQILKERDARTQEVLDKGKEIEQLKMDCGLEKQAIQRELKEKDKQLEVLSNKFNELAKLFDEYIKSFDDIMEVQKLFLRNNLRSQELLQGKIKAFNGEGEKDK